MSNGEKQIVEQITEKSNSLKTCVVVIGAFKQQSNADRMIKRISAQGYNTYREYKNGMNRVGISYDCEHSDPDTFRAKVKKQFNKDAWHLHDTLI